MEKVEKVNHLRSCVSCRSRKVKCDRGEPCCGCERSDVPCVYPAGPGRAPKQPRNAHKALLLDRISRLETIIHRRQEEESGQPGQPPSRASNNTSTEPPVEELGRLVVDDTRSYYISNVLWARLRDEIEELRDALDDPMSDVEDGLTDDLDLTSESSLYAPVPRELGSNAAILGFRSLASSLTPLHPPLSQSVALLEVFKQNVAPLVRIFHMPTLLQLYWDAVASVDTVEKNTEALLFAFYYSAVISFRDDQCLAILGVMRSQALRTYRFAVEQALARANLLNTQNLTLLQAAVLYLTALRNEDSSRTTWSLTALVFHIAQAMGLHRDGAPFNLPPLEIELRRRLWWYICLLDNRSSEYHGCQPIVQGESNFDTRMPLNINDADLTADMRESPIGRDGTTDMTFCLIRCHAMRVMWRIGYHPASLPNALHHSQAAALTLADREGLAQDLQTRLETQYLRHYTSSDSFHHVAVVVTKLIIARTWLVVYYPQTKSQASHTERRTPTQDHADRLFDLSVQVLELSSALLANKDIQQWSWHYQTHFQWHATVIVLSEICRRPPSPQCGRAWEYVNVVYDQWNNNMRESDKRGRLWRPVMRLLAKARYVREIQRASPSSSLGTGGRRQENMQPWKASMLPPGGGKALEVNRGEETLAAAQGQDPLNYVGSDGGVPGNMFAENWLDSMQLMGMGMDIGMVLEQDVEQLGLSPYVGLIP